MQDEANVSKVASEQNDSCWAWFRERCTSKSPPTSIKFTREVVTIAGLRAQLDRQVSGTKSSSLNVEFLPRDCLIPKESDWYKGCVIRVQPEGVVDVKVTSGDDAGKIVQGIPLKRLRSRRSFSAAIKLYYASGFTALFVSYLLLIPLAAFPRYCPLMHGRGTTLDSGWSSSLCKNLTSSRNGSFARRMPIESCAAGAEGDRAFINWLSSSETGVTEELKNPLCRLDPDILFKYVFLCAGISYAALFTAFVDTNVNLSIFITLSCFDLCRCAKIGLGLYSHALAANLGSTIEVPRPTLEAWVLFPLSNVFLIVFWSFAVGTVASTWINWALLIIFEFLWGQALLLLPFFWSFWQRGAMGGGHILGLCIRVLLRCCGFICAV